MRISPFPPKISPDAEAYWKACAGHVLRFQKCSDCGHVRFPPSPVCPRCNSFAFGFIDSAGFGSVYSYVIFRKAFHLAFERLVPYVAAVVDIDEGATLLTNIVGCDISEVNYGMRVRVTWEDTADGVSLPLFEPVREPVEQKGQL